MILRSSFMSRATSVAPRTLDSQRRRRILYVNVDECTSCTACYDPDVCPVGAIYAEDHVPNATTVTKYNANDISKGNDHSFFAELTRAVFAD